ncbi:TMEM165/GDT1 family protein, partial [Candidatus Dependentiae bacterium]|nr:TMEM165/GDT1 family protein [Candidatus Dependentiae bacterium]
MNWKLFFVTFASIFLAELGDKTQLATISFTADNVKYKWIVFFAAAGALVFTTFIG